MNLIDLLKTTIEKNASDLHLIAEYEAYIRIDGQLEPLTKILSSDELVEMCMSILTPEQKERFFESKDLDFAYSLESGDRFRINYFYSKNTLSAAFRHLPNTIKSLDELMLPPIFKEITKVQQGFVLLVGPTGSGKSTTLAAMIQEINTRDKRNIITLEDPIEYIYPKVTSIVRQRELYQDTYDWDMAMRAMLREDPNVVLIGEMRDASTIKSALKIAETGHLTFSTLHTNSASETVQRIVNTFPATEQGEIRAMLAQTITAVISQRLVPVFGGGRRAVIELMIQTPAIASLIREGKEFQIDNTIRTSGDFGMITIEKSLVELIRAGQISVEDGQKYARDPGEIIRLMKTI
ncbi:PilT/PilU family type 4a pilus ATPase [bacterium]|nr:MAG: PilT/PilU family type 4a pilus ATPase [bacterium]